MFFLRLTLIYCLQVKGWGLQWSTPIFAIKINMRVRFNNLSMQTHEAMIPHFIMWMKKLKLNKYKNNDNPYNFKTSLMKKIYLDQLKLWRNKRTYASFYINPILHIVLWLSNNINVPNFRKWVMINLLRILILSIKFHD